MEEKELLEAIQQKIQGDDKSAQQDRLFLHRLNTFGFTVEAVSNSFSSLLLKAGIVYVVNTVPTTRYGLSSYGRLFLDSKKNLFDIEIDNKNADRGVN